MSYPSHSDELRDYIRKLEFELKISRAVADRALEWARHEEAEANRWRQHFYEVRANKRRLGKKYGAIMARKPRARWRRTKKRILRRVTKLTHKPGQT